MGLLDSLRGMFGSSGQKQSKRSRGKVDLRRRFELLKKAITGTMSQFFKARDRETKEIVGLKVLDPEKVAKFEARFKGLDKPSEGEIAVQLQHPNIVRTLEHGISTKNEPFLVMEYIEGPLLSSVIHGPERQMFEGMRLPLIRQIAGALKAVHDAEFIHRDICPRNIMIDTEAGCLKLIDFGLTVPATEPFMRPGNRTGNPNYMAPEVIRRRRTDKRVDVFSFGITVYELMTGELPWSRGTTGKVAMEHATIPPKDIREYRPQIHPVLAEAIHWCLEQDPKDRCPGMDEFLKKIRSVEKEDQ